MNFLFSRTGLWISETEGSKFWFQVVTELKNRGVEDIFIACMDGLKGFPDVVNAVFPQTRIQLCIVHMIRYSTKYVSWKERKTIYDDLKKYILRHLKNQDVMPLMNLLENGIINIR